MRHMNTRPLDAIANCGGDAKKPRDSGFMRSINLAVAGRVDPGERGDREPLAGPADHGAVSFSLKALGLS